MGRTSNAKERLLRTAIELIHARSYGDVGVNELCDGAGVKKGSFYHFFPSKRDLVIEALNGVWAHLEESAFKPAFNESLRPLDRFRKHVELLFQSYANPCETDDCVKGCALGNLATEISTQDDVLRARVCDLLDSWVGYYERAMDDGVEAGEMPPMDTHAGALSLLALLQGAMLLSKVYRDPVLFRRLGERALCLLTSTPKPCAGL